MLAIGYGAEYFYPGMSSSETAPQTVGIQCGRLSFALEALQNLLNWRSEKSLGAVRLVN